MSSPLAVVTESDVEEVMNWFSDSQSVKIWGGPPFRIPFTRESFFKDCCLDDFATYSLWNPDGEMTAFGQLGDRYQRAHLARLISNPAFRGQGAGRQLIQCLLDEARRITSYRECGLFVYRNNEPALKCYQSVGFAVEVFPEGAPSPELCHYMTVKL